MCVQNRERERLEEARQLICGVRELLLPYESESKLGLGLFACHVLIHVLAEANALLEESGNGG